MRRHFIIFCPTVTCKNKREKDGKLNKTKIYIIKFSRLYSMKYLSDFEEKKKHPGI